MRTMYLKTVMVILCLRGKACRLRKESRIIMKKVWIVGSQGHMGQALLNFLDDTVYELFETDRDEVDIVDEAEVLLFMQRMRPDVVINCAGRNPYETRDCADADTLYKVNAVGVRNLAQAAESIQAKLIHLSTDDVFSKQSDVPYNEFDPVSPGDLYGKSKEAGERFVTQLMTRYVIVRSSWIYGIGRDFLDVVIQAADDPNTKQLVLEENETAIPTSAEELAKVIGTLIEGEHYGIYHAVCSGSPCTRKEYAEEILRLIGKEDQLEVCVKEGGKQPYSVLDNMMLRINDLPVPGDWRETLAEYITRTGGKQE